MPSSIAGSIHCACTFPRSSRAALLGARQRHRIAPQYHGRIFGIFKRLHGKEIPGTGIGLAICQRIVEWHGGKIWVDSDLGSGAVFHFTLAKEPQRAQREMVEFASLGGKLRESASRS